MGRMTAVGRLVRRFRNSRGYGVHSPLGFELVKTVVRPDTCYRYYVYEDIEDAVEEMRLSGRKGFLLESEAKMVARLSGFLDTRHAFVSDTVSPLIETALRGVRKDMDISRSLYDVREGSLIITDRVKDLVQPVFVRALSLSDTSLLLCGDAARSPLRDNLCGNMTGGVVFDGDRHFLLINRSNTGPYHYHVFL